VGCLAALAAGWEALMAGGSALDAVERAVMAMEDNPVFDAGSNAHLNADGEVELDACIMEGSRLEAGAVAAVQGVRNPVQLARRVLESPHWLLVGDGARRFAAAHEVEVCDPRALVTARRRREWEASGGTPTPASAMFGIPGDTVGAVALDGSGTIAAATSTCGNAGKPPGRVGDSPIVGASTYARSGCGGVSVTGWGEGIVRVVWAKGVVDLLHGGLTAPQAAAAALGLLAPVGAIGGLVVLDGQGRAGAAHNSTRMAYALRAAGSDGPIAG
jgi:beta-aspartyl-peptidase (threonine type)